MNTKEIIIGVVTLLLGLVIGAVVFGGHGMNLGTTFNAAVTETNPYWFYNGFKAGKSSQFIADSSGTVTAGAATFNGNVNVTTSNTATSTVTVGCVQMYATSTATAVHLEFSTTTTLAGYGTQKTGHAVAWRYGKCPI